MDKGAFPKAVPLGGSRVAWSNRRFKIG
ncbi:hypothetical protein ACQCP0_18985 [Ralstonia pseudosolanacearum]